MPGGITYGQHWLNVKFEKSLVRVPFRILTKDEEKLLSKNYRTSEAGQGRVQAEEEVVGGESVKRKSVTSWAAWPRLNPS